MLFRLHPGFDSFDASAWEPYAVQITNLLDAHRHARHLVVAERQTLVILEQCGYLGAVCQKTVRDILHKRPEVNSLQTRLRRFVTVYSPQNAQQVTPNAREFAVDINALTNPDILQHFSLIVENMNTDGFFWQLVLSAVAENEGVYGPMPNLDIVHGGGNTTADVVKGRADKHQPFYCIVDSDRRSPFAANSATAAKVEEFLVNSGIMLAGKYGLSPNIAQSGFSVLEAREAENLLPLRTLRSVLEDIGSNNYAFVERAVPSQPNLGDAIDRAIWLYYDIKRDVDVNALAFSSNDEQQYFTRLRNRLGDTLPRVRDGLLSDLSAYCSNDHRSRRAVQAYKQVAASPFYPMMLDLFVDIYSLACRPQSRYF